MERGSTSLTPDSESKVVVLQGVLEKVAKIGFNSRKLCVLTKSEFFYYSDNKARGSVKHISLQAVQAVKRDHSSKGFQFEIITHHKTETFAAETLEVCQHWLKALQSTLLTTRRISVSSANTGGTESARSPVSRYGGHGYEEVDLDEEGPVTAAGQNSSQPPKATSPAHAYETIDLDEEHKPKIDKPIIDKPKAKPATRGVCGTVDALGGPPGSVLPQGNNDAQSEPSEKHNLTPIGSEPDTTVRPNAMKTPPALPPKPISTKSPYTEVKPTPAPRTRAVCTTVDALGGPSGTSSANSPPSESQPYETPLYSEVMTPKRSDLYTECKKLKEEQQREERQRGDSGDIEGPAPSSGDTYSQAYSYAKVPEEGIYSEVSDVMRRGGETTRSGIYSFAKGISGDVPMSSETTSTSSSVSVPLVSAPSTSTADVSTVSVFRPVVKTKPMSNQSRPSPTLHATNQPEPTAAASQTQAEKIYSDAMSCQSSVQQANQDTPPRTTALTDDQTTRSSNDDAIRDVNSNAIPIPSPCYGPMTRHEAINKLDQFLSSSEGMPNQSAT